MRYATRKDANHNEIVKALQQLGWGVMETHQFLGLGFDCIAVRGASVWFVEIKDGNKAESQRKLTTAEKAASILLNKWYVILKSVDDCIALK
jgi:Holliday junction resolvase-like predicted endonuclease